MDNEGLLLGRYDKAHLVPFGEYLPLRPLLSAIGLTRLVPGTVDFWPGPGPRTMVLPGAKGRAPLRIGVQICYEIVFSGHVVEPGNRPDFIFNPSNDAWFGSWGPPQHLAQARLRAIEEGLPVIRSTPTGISALVDASGHVLQSIGLDRQGAISASLPPAHSPTLFSRGGNAISARSCAPASGERRCLCAAQPLRSRHKHFFISIADDRAARRKALPAMRSSYLFTSESVSEGHPDKVSDQISDTVVDLFLSTDPEARIACETLTTTQLVVLAGEIRCKGVYENGEWAPGALEEIEAAVRNHRSGDRL